MPRGPAPAWHQKAAHTVEAERYVAAAFRVGYEQEMRWTGIPARERARTLKNGLFNAARLHKPPVSVSYEIVQEGRTWTIRFTLHDKKIGRAHVVGSYGTDRRQWPYDTREKG
jgi:hypothetical protein